MAVRSGGLATRAGTLARWLTDGFDAKLLGFAGIVPLYRSFIRVSLSLSTFLSASVSGAGCIAALCLSSLIVASVLFGCALRGRVAGLRAKAVLCLVSTALLAAFLAGSFADAGDIFLAVMSCGAFSPAGVLLVLLFVAWAQVYARVPSPQMLVYAALALFLGTLLQPLLVSSVGEWMIAVVVMGCSGLSSVLLLVLARSEKSVDCAGEEPSRTELQRDEWSLPATVRLSINLITWGFVLQFFLSGVLALPPNRYVNAHNAGVVVLACGIAVAAMVAFAIMNRQDGSYNTVRSKAFFIVPVFATFVAFFSFIRMLDLNADSIAKNVLALGGDTAENCFYILAFYLAALNSAERSIDIELLTAPLIALSAVFYAVGAVLYGALRETATYAQLVLEMVYILCLSLVATHKASLNDEVRTKNRCMLLAEARGLSARETEVLTLLALDYSIRAIAERLYISPETVRTHIKRIYAKAGIHKREELLRLVRSERTDAVSA